MRCLPRISEIVVLSIVVIGLWRHLGVGEEGKVQTPSSRITIRNNVIKDNTGIGIYAGRQHRGEILIENNLIVGNGEGIRWASATLGRIIGNEIRDNVVGLKVIDVFIGPGGKPVYLRVSPVLLQLNTLVNNKEYGVLNLTDVPLIAELNFWGAPSGPLRADRPKPKLQIVLTRRPVLILWGFGGYFQRLAEGDVLEGPLAIPSRQISGATLAALSGFLAERKGSALLDGPSNGFEALQERGSLLALEDALYKGIRYVWAYEPRYGRLPEVVKGPIELKGWLKAKALTRRSQAEATGKE